MKRKSSKVQLKEWGACDDGYAWAIKRKSWKALWANCPRGDWMIWLLRKIGNWTHAQKVEIAIACAEHVLHIYEAKNPNDKRPRQAIDAAKTWLVNPCEETRQAAADAAYAAYAAADAAYAAYAAADAERLWQADAVLKIVADPWKEEEEEEKEEEETSCVKRHQVY